MTGDMMLVEFQRIIERALALHAPIMACYIRTEKLKFLLHEKWLREETKKQAFLSLNRQNMYKIYIDIFKKLQEKDTFIERVITQLAEKLLDNKFVSGQDNREHAMVEVAIQTDNSEQVRDFQKISIKDVNENLVIGSSIIGKLEQDTTIPADIGVHAYRGSTTNEKLRVLKDYEAKKLKTLVLQDGTNNVLKHTSKSAEVNFEEFKQLVNLCVEKFTPETFVLCEIPPLKDLEHNTQKNNIIDKFKSLLHDYCDNVDRFKNLPLNDYVKSAAIKTGDSASYNYLFYDNVHFNYQHGVPLLKNWLLYHLLLSSNGRIAQSYWAPQSGATDSTQARQPLKLVRAQFTIQNRYQPFQRAVKYSHNSPYNNQLPYRANSYAYKFNGSNSGYGF